MKFKTILAVTLIALLSFSNSSCKKEHAEVETDPAKAILGKWEITQMGNWPNMMPYEASGYTEYLADSVVRFYEYSTYQYTYAKYWVDSLLYTCVKREDGVQIITDKERYQFSNGNNKLRLDLLYPSTFNTSIYKRIK